MGDTSGARRLLHLDGIRGLLALSVAASHIYGSIYHWGPTWPFIGSYLAVDFFFILSGYVLSYTLSKGDTSSWGKFIAKRAFRLWPLHVVCLVAFIAVVNNNVLTQQYVPDWWDALTERQLLANILFLQNVGLGNIPVMNDPSWSISIEFWISSMLLFPVARQKSLWVPLILAIGAWVFIFALHGPNLRVQLNFVHYVNFGVMRGVGGMMLGNVLFRLHALGLPSRLRFPGSAPAQAVFIAIVAWAVFYQDGRAWLDLPITLAFCCVVLFMDGARALGRLFSLGPLVWLGEISFAVYLCHSAVIILAPPLYYDKEFGIYAPAVLMGAIVVASYMLHVSVEHPSRRFLYGLVKAKETSPAHPAANDTHWYS
ncbi:acyltransferase family protein [Paraburkholderia silviterrae]|uniref:Acyltransferase n=1 Tax=Paraburkholderia silviterrae TaxID=2528715 RepID=A0A4V2ZZ05_9BURK|nr:acyltransferase [Paraburkholderia silviterrae]TDG23138.1 acyltransferase [Paraburkholderia silviterrae]